MTCDALARLFGNAALNETLQVPTMPVPPEQAQRSFVDAATGGTGGDTMRLTLIGTAVAALTTATLLAAPANADRYCRKVCDNGFCRSSCVESRDRLYMYDRGDYRDRDSYHHRRHGLDVEGPGFGVEIDR
jgi:hypothetical protein